MKKLFVAIAFILVAGLLGAQARFDPDPRITPEIAAMEEMPAETFAYMALVASGASDAEIPAYLQRLSSFAQKFRSELSEPLSVEETADAALQFIYRNILFKYKFIQTCVDAALDSGVYNCVSSDVVFMYFAKVLGIKVVAQETPNHAFCTIIAESGLVDVETTNPYGVNPGKKRSKPLPNGGTQYTVVPAKNYNGRHPVDDRRVIAMIYQNRISDMQTKRQNIETIGLAVDSFAVQNYLDYAKHNVTVCVCNSAASLIKAGRNAEALELVMYAQQRFGSYKNYTGYIESLNYNILVDKVKTLPLQESLAEIESKREILSAKNYNSLVSYAYGAAAQEAAQKLDWPLSIEIVKQGLSVIPNDPNLKKAFNVYKQNYAIDFHNRAAALFNKGDIEGAQAAIKEGLKELPDNAMLKKDLQQMK